MQNNQPSQSETKLSREKSDATRAKTHDKKSQSLQLLSPEKSCRAGAASTRGADSLLALSALHFALLLLLWFAEFVGERNRWTAFLLYLPQQGLVFAPLLLLLCTARRQWQRRRASPRGASTSQKRRGATGVAWLLNIASAALVWLGFLGFNLPFAGFHSAPQDALKLRAMSFNVRLGISGAPRIAEIIRRENADIACLQETRALGVHRDVVPQLQKLLPEWKFARSGEVTTLSRFPIVKTRVHPIENLQRVVLETQIEARGRRVSVWNTHFITDRARPKNVTREISSLGGSASLRLHQMRQLQNVVPQNAPRVLVMGDFNNPPRGLLYRRLSSRWTDAFRAAGFGFGYTFRSDLPLMRIDYIWASRDVRVLAAHVSRGHASDHRAVVAEVAVD